LLLYAGLGEELMMIWLVGFLTAVEVIRLLLSIQDNRHVRELNRKVNKQQEAWQAEQVRWRDAEIVELKELVKGSKELERIIEEIASDSNSKR
jgi:hypothetical protein